MKIRTVSEGVDERLIIDSFSYGNLNEMVNSYDIVQNRYALHYVTQGIGDIDGMLVSAYTKSSPNFLDKTKSSATLIDGVLTLPSKKMTLVFFTAPSTGIYRLRIDCQAIEFPENCNIWYFKGDNESGYKFLEIDGVNNRHDPQFDRTVFPLAVTLSKGQSIVIGIGNYFGAVLKLHEFSVTCTKSSDKSAFSKRYELISMESPNFAFYDHPHSAANSHLKKTGDGFLLRPGESITFSSKDPTSINIFRIAFHGEGAEHYFKLVDPGLHGIFSHGFTSKLSEIIPLIFVSDRPIKRGLASLVFDDILSMHENKQSMKVNLYVEDAKERILRNLKHQIRVTDIAAELGVSDRYLYNLFVKFEGVSPKQFINNARISKAKKLLTELDMTVTEVAESVGFSDVLNFSHFFSGQTGISPSKFRKK